jgi:hypothetical protein
MSLCKHVPSNPNAEVTLCWICGAKVSPNAIGVWVEVTNLRCEIVQSQLGRWYLQHHFKPWLAWFGSRWVLHFHGIGSEVQVSNFETVDEAREYAGECGLVVV